MKDLPKDNGNKESKKSPSEQDYVEANTTSTENKKSWMKLSAWATLLSVVAAVILLSILLNQKKPKDTNSSSRQRNKISLENKIIKPKNGMGAGKESIAITDVKSDSNDDFPPKNLTKEAANPGGIYENHLAVSEESLVDKAPMLKFMPLRLNLSPAKPTDKFWIRNDGRPDLTFTLSTNSSRISAVPASGRLKTDQVIYITVTGTTEGIVIIDSNGGYDNVKVSYQP